MIESASSTSTQPSSRRISAQDGALDVLHHDEVLAGALVAAGVEDLDDVGVHQPRGRLRLALEARHEGGVVGEVLGEQLDRHLALQAQVEREVHGRHPAEAEPALQAVAPGDLDRAHLHAFLRRRPRPAPPGVRRFTADAGRRRPGPLDAPGSLPLPGAGVPPPGVVAVGVVGVVVVGVGSFRSWSWSWSWSASSGARGRRGGARRGRRRGRLRERLGAQRERAARRFAIPTLSVLRRPASTRRGQRGEVLFGLRDRGFGGGAAAVAALRGLRDGFEVALQRPGVGGRDQALAGAAAGDEQGGGAAPSRPASGPAARVPRARGDRCRLVGSAHRH